MTEAEWEEGRSLAPEVLREKIFRGGLSPEVRLQGWRFLLGLGGGDPQEKERRDSYLRMKLQWGTLSPGQWSRNSFLRGFRRRIEKDLSGGPPLMPPQNRGLLRELLLTYCMFNFDLGYVRGMSEVLSPLLSVAPLEVEAFWGFCSIMEMVGGSFGPGPEGLKRQLGYLSQLGRVLDPNLCEVLELGGPQRCCCRWLQWRFQTPLGLEGTLRVWEVLWTGLPCPNFLLLLCCVLLEEVAGAKPTPPGGPLGARERPPQGPSCSSMRLGDSEEEEEEEEEEKEELKDSKVTLIAEKNTDMEQEKKRSSRNSLKPQSEVILTKATDLKPPDSLPPRSGSERNSKVSSSLAAAAPAATPAPKSTSQSKGHTLKQKGIKEEKPEESDSDQEGPIATQMLSFVMDDPDFESEDSDSPKKKADEFPVREDLSELSDDDDTSLAKPAQPVKAALHSFKLKNDSDLFGLGLEESGPKESSEEEKQSAKEKKKKKKKSKEEEEKSVKKKSKHKKSKEKEESKEEKEKKKKKKKSKEKGSEIDELEAFLGGGGAGASKPRGGGDYEEL